MTATRRGTGLDPLVAADPVSVAVKVVLVGSGDLHGAGYALGAVSGASGAVVVACDGEAG